MSLERVRAKLASAGLELVGTLPVEIHDSLVAPPWRARELDAQARGVLIVGSGGRALWQRFCAWSREPARAGSLPPDPLDAYTRGALEQAAALQTPDACFVLYNETRAGGFLPLMKLGERAGLGSPGRIGVLIHPVYGPWIAIRAALYLREPVPFAEPRPYRPCDGCPAPCERACHGGVVSERGLDLKGCLQTRTVEPACRAGCDARRACVVAPEHAYDAEQTAFHSAPRIRAPWG